MAIVDRTANIEDAAWAIVSARFSRAGTSSYAPDVVLINEFVIEEFIGLLSKIVRPSKAKSNEDSQDASLKSTLFEREDQRTVLVIHAISSLDDGIDFANGNAAENLAASFVFASLPEANYLANLIGSHFCIVNHIPAELLGMLLF
ncbi:hypothetical protein MMC08_008554 [Hypocenomyce scalaris]|nr:hypothetical protein [Hypocenomyce scalaris]